MVILINPVLEEKMNNRFTNRIVVVKRAARKILADELRENIVNNFVNYIKEKYL